MLLYLKTKYNIPNPKVVSSHNKDSLLTKRIFIKGLIEPCGYLFKSSQGLYKVDIVIPMQMIS